MNQQDETFLTTKQEPLKLSIAIERYFGKELLTEPLKVRYGTFLRKRIRSALPFVIREGNFPALVQMAEEGFLCGPLYQEAILMAADAGKTEMTVYLLRNQERLDTGKETSLELDF